MNQETINRIHALNLDPFTETAVCEIVQAAIDGAAGRPATALALQLPADWPTDYQDIFWLRYPRRDDKKKAMIALDKVAFAGKTRWPDLLAGIEQYKRSSDVKRGCIKLPATFLNGESWKNEYTGSTGPKSSFDTAVELLSRTDGQRTDHDEQYRR